MSDVKELLAKVNDDEIRKQLSEVYDELAGSALRQKVEELTDQVKTYREKDRIRAFKDAGFDPESGPGKALAKLYEGEADPEAIKVFAKEEFDFEPPSSTPQDNGTHTTSTATGDDRLAQVAQGTIPPRSPSTRDQIKEAEAAGDLDTVARLNLQLMHEQNA
ncbi:MAG TPA: hypothetical protein VIG24_05915 [Acidimicrobiia bacterium]